MTPAVNLRHPRLVGSATLVWRSADDLQVGLDEDAVILCRVPRPAEDVLRRLDGSHTTDELHKHLPPAWVAWLLEQLADHGRLADGPPVPRPLTIRVVGTGPLAAAAATSLAAAGVRLRIVDPDPGGAHRSRHLAAALSTQRRPGDRPVPEPELDLRSAAVALTLVATDAAEPDRTLTDLLVAARLPHLVLRLQPGRAVVGPLVVPGRTACLRCSDLARATADSGWPVVACQLARLVAPAAATAVAWASALATAHATAYAAGGSPESLFGTLELADDGLTRFRRWVAHPRCGCRNVELEQGAARMGA